jgi:Fe-S-cluster containining protein
MSIEEKVNEVAAVFDTLDKEIEGFRSSTGLHCKFGCGKCCLKPDIEVTLLEFLPFALHLYQTNQIENWHEKLSENESPICLILDQNQTGAGLCSQYKYRGLICRLFGYSARTTKYGQKELVTCQIIKTEQADKYQLANKLVSDGHAVPVMSNYYMLLRNIDPDLSTTFLPINQAIKAAIEKVLSYYAYR